MAAAPRGDVLYAQALSANFLAGLARPDCAMIRLAVEIADAFRRVYETA